MNNNSYNNYKQRNNNMNLQVKIEICNQFNGIRGSSKIF